MRGEYQYASRTFFDPSNVLANSRGAYGLVHASIGYTPAQGHWSVALWGRNLTDKVVRAGYAGGSPPLGHFVTNPRTFGIRINYTR